MVSLEVENIIKQVGRFTVAAMRQDLAKHKLSDSNLSKNIKFKPMKTRVTIELPDYAKFVDRGVQGAIEKRFNSPYSYKTKYPPFEVIYDWIKRYRSKIGRGRSKGGQFISDASLAFAIRTAIYRRGLKPRPFIDNNLEAGYALLVELINNPKTSDKIFSQAKFKVGKVKI
jgi:hypothetical protein